MYSIFLTAIFISVITSVVLYTTLKSKKGRTAVIGMTPGYFGVIILVISNIYTEPGDYGRILFGIISILSIFISVIITPFLVISRKSKPEDIDNKYEERYEEHSEDIPYKLSDEQSNKIDKELKKKLIYYYLIVLEIFVFLVLFIILN